MPYECAPRDYRVDDAPVARTQARGIALNFRPPGRIGAARHSIPIARPTFGRLIPNPGREAPSFQHHVVVKHHDDCCPGTADQEFH